MRHLLIESHLSAIIWHPPIDNRRALLGAVESNIIWQESVPYPCVCNRYGDLGCGPCRDSSAELHPLQAAIWKALQMVVLDNHLQMIEPLLKFRFPAQKYSTVLEQEREYEFKMRLWFQIQGSNTKLQGTWKFKETQNCQGDHRTFQ